MARLSDAHDARSVSPPPDAVVALHACGGLSDAALRLAATHQAQLVVVPGDRGGRVEPAPAVEWLPVGRRSKLTVNASDDLVKSSSFEFLPSSIN